MRFVIVAALTLLIFSSLVHDFEVHSVAEDNSALRSVYEVLEGISRFLASQYVPEAGLLRAATHADPDLHRIYIASDNILASEALKLLGITLRNQTLYELGINVSRSISIYVEKLCRVHGWCTPFDFKHEVLLGYPTMLIPLATETVCFEEIYSRRFGTKFEVCTEIPTSVIVTSWKRYADFVAYRAMMFVAIGRYDDARKLFVELLEMWDGYGFRDAAYQSKGIYETYKIALAIYLCKILNATSIGCPAEPELVERWIKIVFKLQRGDGGIATNYRVVNGQVIPVGDANVETTSIVALALTSMHEEFLRRVEATRLLLEMLILSLTIATLSILLWRFP